ncbi:3591_t:CDS:2 [Dentiscutata heterogama]|uniref:3591_t:CDS:1 n=1 Tax=Dentiscutata heterogama TaxID=1316150 RepID=A0ACA9M369_9GLOM|nr:3591_t:CDS:2 [Dentiscutata heterogama]
MAFRTLTDEDTSIQDNAIRGTNEDAITSKLSAVNAGYIQDDYVKYFHKRPTKRSPLINRGSISSLQKFYKYFEIDFPEITAKKAAIIRKNKELSEIIGDDARIGRLRYNFNN